MQTTCTKIALFVVLLLCPLFGRAQTTVPVINGGTGCTTAPCALGALAPGISSPGAGGLVGNPGSGQTWEIAPNGNATLGTVASCTVNDFYVAGSSCYPTITSAEMAAIAAGKCIYIPAGYAGSDAVNPGGGYQCGIDNRNGAFQFFHYMTPMHPIANYPMGSDAVYSSLGPADTYIGPNIPGAGNLAFTTSSTAATAGVNATYTIANVCTANGQNAFSLYGILVNQGHDDFESVGGGNYSFPSCTSINFTPAKNHAAGFGINQDAPLHLRNYITFNIPTPPGPAIGHTQPVTWTDNDQRENPYMEWPGSTVDAWPYNVIRFNTANSGLSAVFTGYSENVATSPLESPADLVLTRNAGSSYCTRMRSSTATDLFVVCDGQIYMPLLNAAGLVTNSSGGAFGTTVNPSINSLILQSQGAGALTIGTNGTTTQGNVLAGGSSSSNYRGLCIDDNATASNCSSGSQASTALSSWRVDIGGSWLNWPGTNDTFTIGRVAAGGTFSTPANLFQIDSSGNIKNQNGIILPSTLNGYNGNASGVKVPLAVAFAGVAGVPVCDDGSHNLTETGCTVVVTGTVTSSSGTATTAHSFSTSFGATPVCTASPYSNSGSWYFSTLPSVSSSGVITYMSSGAQTFSIQCVGTGGVW